MARFINNPIYGIKTFPDISKNLILLVILYLISTLSIGFYSGLFLPGIINYRLIIILPFTLFLYPSFIEELFFRGLIIPYDTIKYSNLRKLKYIFISTLLYVLWHPLNAFTINRDATSFFLNPYFLIITALLGITCSISYILSRSLWTPIFIHWLTVLIWVIFLGGRNKILELNL